MQRLLHWIHHFLHSRFWELIVKEKAQLLRNRQLLVMLVFPPTIQLCVYAYVLSPEVQNLPIGIVDQAKVVASRELISALTENKVFVVKAYRDSQKEIGELLQQGKITAAVIIPPEFNRDLHRVKTGHIQVLIDGVDAYTAGIASGYIQQILMAYSNRFLQGAPRRPGVVPQIMYFYNRGLVGSWFFVPGVMGTILTFTSSLSAAVESVREKDTGTLEQLLMTPASSLEILIAKVIPLFILLMGVVFLSLAIGHFMFQVPFRGSLLLFTVLSGFFVVIEIGIGILLGTLSENKPQVILTAFFINLPMILLSGALTPIESMPLLFRIIAQFNPLSHYIIINRGILLKGVGLDILWPHALTLICFAIVVFSISSWRYRAQLR
jgi:ABC-2 type transport system permease protein